MIRACIALALLVACNGQTISGTSCDSDKDCNLFNAQGRCEATGWCSFPDGTCISGFRYGPGAGDDLGNTCSGDQMCGGKDQNCCGAGVCADNLTCAIEVGTCQCGGDGQPCCDGTTCGTNLHCGNAAVCGSTNVLQVAAGAGHVCVLFENHTVECWGQDYKPFAYYPGLGEAVISSTKPTPIDGATDIVELRAAEMHTCGKKSDKTLWCWGHNETGQLGDGTFKSSKVAVRVAGLTNVTKFDGGRLHTCALGDVKGESGLWCWGRGGEGAMHMPTSASGRLGNGGATDSNVPVKVNLAAATSAGQTVKSLSTGSYHSCVVMSDDKTWCWGRNAGGELGNGMTTSTRVPVQVSYAGITIPTGVTVDQVSCSDGRRKNNSTCLLLSDGTVYCWGTATQGQLGDGTTVNRGAPATAVDTTPLGSAKVVQLAAGQEAKCARTDAGGIWCWGYNRNGLIGNNDPMQSSQPKPVPAMLTGATQLEMSHKVACAIDGAKQLYCWGTNHRGQAKARTPTSDEDGATLVPTKLEF